jgi:GTP-binding protein
VAFELVDTGGMFGHSEDPLHRLVIEHGRRAIKNAHIIVFVVDGREGPVAGDAEIAQVLRQRAAPVVVAMNKTDDRNARGRDVEFYEYGFEPVIEIAAEHGQGVGDLLDEIVSRLPATARRAPAGEDREDEGGRSSETRVAIVGRPNVGKSSLVNRLLREERVMVSDMPGTTRDAVDALMHWHQRAFRIVDTAGIRRPGRVSRAGQVEQISVIAARRAIEQADVAVLLVDAIEGVTDQDAAIAGEAHQAGCGIIIAVNKWDLRKGQGADAAKQFDEEVRRKLKFLDYAPVIHISALTGERTPRLLELIDSIGEGRRKRIPTSELNKFIEAVTASHPPASPGRREVRILYAAQVGTAPPKFVLFTNVAVKLHFSYERFLINRLRDAFGFQGVPIRLLVRRRERR